MGYKIKEVREEKRMTQEELAKKKRNQPYNDFWIRKRYDAVPVQQDPPQHREGAGHFAGPDFFC